MSLLSKRFVAGKTILGVVVLGSLALTGCSAPASNTSDSSSSASQPSDSPSTSATPSPAVSSRNIEFNSNSFDSSKQKSFTAKWSEASFATSNGAVSVQSGSDGKAQLTYTPYDNPESLWTYTSDTPITEPKANLMRWKGKSYIVLHGMTTTAQAASGLNSGTESSAEIVIILEMETGKVANTIKGGTISTTGGQTTSGYGTPKLINDKTIPDLETGRATIPAGLYDTEPYMVGLVYGAGESAQPVTLVDPLTGKVIATDTKQNQHYNEAGFWKYSETYSGKSFGVGEGNLDAVFGNYMIVTNQKAGKGGNVSYTEFRLVNTVTKEVSAPSACADDRKDANIGMRFSPDFRYVNAYGRIVIDTQTGKAYCQPAGHPEVRAFNVSFVDNDGNMYGQADKDYLKVNIADTSKTQQWTDGKFYSDRPIDVTSKNSLVLSGGEATNRNFTVIPEKK